MLSNRRVEGIAPLRDDLWLDGMLNDIWGQYFESVPRANEVVIEFSRHWKTRLGLIRMSESQSRTYIGINGLLRHPDVPEVVVLITAAHELCHYTHGFGSPLPRLFAHPHAGNVVGKELEARGLGRELLFYGDWIADCWQDYYDRQVGAIGQPRSTGAEINTRPAAAAGAHR